MGMKITVRHSTVYRYDSPVYLEPHIFRLRPRASSAQRLLTFNLQITPTPAGTAECLDQDGNLALNAWFGAPTVDVLLTADDSPLAPKREASLPRVDSQLAQRMRAMTEVRHAASFFFRSTTRPFLPSARLVVSPISSDS